MAGAEPDAARPEEQGAFKQAVVDQVIKTADKTGRNQHRLIQRQPGHARANAEQNDADILQRVVRQKTLDIVLHQRVQAADEGGDHARNQQHHAPPQRRLSAGQRNRQDPKQTDLHHHHRKQRGGGRGSIRMRLRHPAVQRNDAGEQAKADHAQQPDVIAQRMPVKRSELQRAETLPHPPAGQRQQQRPEASQRKPHFPGGAAAGQEHAAQRHNLRHHHQRAEVASDHGAHRRRHQQVHQQAVGFGVRMAVPVDIEQADKQPAQAKGHQPDGVQRRNRNGVANQRHHGLCGLPAEQDNPTRRQRHQAADRPADPGDPAAQGFME